MNSPRLNENAQFICESRELAKELVRGKEQELVEKMRPIVSRQSVRIDLSGVERIDAAGLAALVSLYCDARKAGHEFAVVNPARRVARVLAIVGLDRVLVSKELGGTPQPESRMDEVAA